MKKACVLTTISVAVMVAAAPARAGSPALVVGLVAAGVVGTVLVVSATQSASGAWTYTPERGWVTGPRDDVATINAPLVARSGVSERLVSACRDAIAATAKLYDLASLEAVPAGAPTRAKGRVIAPLEVRAIYRVQGVHEVRRSTVRCELDRAGRVVSTS
jgi:hypothetical protein